MTAPTFAEAAEAIGVPVEDWPGRCYEIACAIHRAGLVPETFRPVYGFLWLPDGPEPGSYFAEIGRRHLTFHRHGWLQDDEAGTIIDPTRWTFEWAGPEVVLDRLYEERMDPSGPYDEGGIRLRASMLKPPPAYAGGKSFLLRVQGAAAKTVCDLLGTPSTMDDPLLDMPMAFWLANVPLNLMGEDAPEIVEAFVEAGMAALVPLDNREAAEEMKARRART